MTLVLKGYGYLIDGKPQVNYAGMEIDIEGHEALTQAPLYAECKCYDTEIDSPKLQAFAGKFMTRWLKNKRCSGLFIALPCLNSYARGFYKENFAASADVTLKLLEEGAVIDAILNLGLTVPGNTLHDRVPMEFGATGDQLLLYTEHGLIWAQYLISPGSAIADRFTLFDQRGNPVTESQTIEYVIDVCPELNGFAPVVVSPTSAAGGNSNDAQPPPSPEPDQIVEVHGSSSWFEYQFPASPEYFVGRADLLEEVSKFASGVASQKVTARGILFTGSSGWGKSSVVLAAANALQKMGHYAVVIDCRSISAALSVLRIVDYAIERLSPDWGELFQGSTRISGFDGAIRALERISEELARNNRLGFIFLDQFENVFFMPDALTRIRDLLLKMCDNQANIVFGFAWKTDLIGETTDFPYRVRDAITDCSKNIPLATFSDVETNELLDKLRAELKTQLRKDLRFFLSEFSQGFPWLLKKLCAHVKAQRESGVPQAQIANRLLNIEQLFKEDLGGLTAEQEDTLRRIAKSAPVTGSELSEQYRGDVVQSLVDRRLVIRIGSKFDIYWDIFRDYLNNNRVPAQENYLPRVHVGAVIDAMGRLIREGGPVEFREFQAATRRSEHSAMNLVRDLRLLGLVTIDSGRLVPNIRLQRTATHPELVESVRTHLQRQLLQNRLVSRLILDLKTEGALDLASISDRLSQWCPYATATPKTWRMYASVLAAWMDLADLATYNSRRGSVSYYEPATEFRQRLVNFKRQRRPDLIVPSIQFSPVESVALAIAAAVDGKRPIWEGFAKSTLSKSLATLEDLGFIFRTERGYRTGPLLRELAAGEKHRRFLFGQAISKLPSFQHFLSLLREHSQGGCSHLELGRKLNMLLVAGHPRRKTPAHEKTMAT